MKTAISLPDELFKDADRMAQQLGMSRSELFRTALEAYLQRHGSERITELLNEIYSHEASSLDPALERVQCETIDPEEG
ncbi:MAG: CopG family ribbon-helix-helix protein [Candidatus Bipolaricaulia bacterium]